MQELGLVAVYVIFGALLIAMAVAGVWIGGQMVLNAFND